MVAAAFALITYTHQHRELEILPIVDACGDR
jgi:hypothetical protein